MEEFRIMDLFKYFLTKKLIIILSAILAFLIGYLYVNYYQVPMYKGTTTLIIIQKNSSKEDISQSELDVSEKLVSTYSEIIKSRRVLEQVINELELEISVEDLAKKIEVSSISDTAILQITVKDNINEEACLIANTVASVFKTEIVSIYNIENISIIDEAVAKTEPYNISPFKYYIIFSFLGVVISCLGIFIVFYFDNTIKVKKEIEDVLGLPVLGEISHVRINKKKIYKKANSTIISGNQIDKKDIRETKSSVASGSKKEPIKKSKTVSSKKDSNKDNKTKKSTTTKKKVTKDKVKEGGDLGARSNS